MWKLKLSLIIVFFSSFQLFSQVNDDIYLKHINGYGDTCLYSLHRDGSNKRPTPFVHQFKYGCFVFLNNYFQVKPNTFIQEINEEDTKKINIVTIDYFLRKREETPKTQLADPNSLFNKIYILVPGMSGTYFKFEVQWKEVFID